MLINCAGINIQDRDWDDIDEKDWDKIFSNKCKWYFLLLQICDPYNEKKKDGLIINVSSWAGKHVGLLSGVSYTSSNML